MKIGFIGFGNMAKAIAGGINLQNIVPASEICVYDINDDAKNAAKALNYSICESENEIIKNCEFVFLCIKPQQFPNLLTNIKNDVKSENKFLSIAAGISTKSIEKIIGDAPIIRAMPNTPLLLGHGTVALCKNERVSENDYIFIKKIFESVGMVQDLDENLFDEVIDVSGSTPAFVYLFAKIIADYADEHGIKREIALPMFCNTMVGASKMLTQTQFSPQELISMVASKGGTTQAALDSFEDNDFEGVMRKALDACLNRAKELNI